MASSQSPRYTRPADLREMEYEAFEANGIVGNGTTVLLPARGIKHAHQVHSIIIVHAVASVLGTLTIQSAGGKVLFKTALGVAGIMHLQWGEFPWGYLMEANAPLQAVVADTASPIDIAIKGYATS